MAIRYLILELLSNSTYAQLNYLHLNDSAGSIPLTHVLDNKTTVSYGGDGSKIINHYTEVLAEEYSWWFAPGVITANAPVYAVYSFDAASVPVSFTLRNHQGYPAPEFKLWLTSSVETPDSVWAEDRTNWQLLHYAELGGATLQTEVAFDSGVIFGYLLRNAAGEVYQYDGGFNLVNATDPTEANFADSGMPSLPHIPIAELLAWEPSGNFMIEFYDSSASLGSSKSLNVSSVVGAQIAVPVGIIALTGTESLDGIAITQTLSGTGASRFAVSVDGSSWLAWDGSAWQSITGLTVDQAGADQLITSGMTAAELQALTWAELQQLYAGAPTAIAIAYAVEVEVVDDVAAIDLVELTVTHAGKWVRDHGQIELALSSDRVTVTPSVDCSYKINYQDA